MNPFQEHAQNTADYQAMLRGDDESGGAVMTIDGEDVPCTASQLIIDFQPVPGGNSSCKTKRMPLSSPVMR